MKYTTEVDVENYLLTTIDPAFMSGESGQTQVDKWIEGMSRAMDKKCNRTLVSDTPGTRKFDGNGKTSLMIDEVCDITAITVDGTNVLSSVYQYPIGEERTNELKMETQTFSKGLQNVEVAGIFAMHSAEDVDAVPEDIRWACTVLVAGVVSASQNQNDAIKAEKVGNYSVTYSDPNQRKDYLMALDILKAYRRIAI